MPTGMGNTNTQEIKKLRRCPEFIFHYSASQFLADSISSKYLRGWPVRAVRRSANLRFIPVTPSTAVFWTWSFVAAEAVFMAESKSVPTLVSRKSERTNTEFKGCAVTIFCTSVSSAFTTAELKKFLEKS